VRVGRRRLSRRAFAGSVASGAVVAGVPAVARPAAASSPRGGFAFQTTGTSIGDLPAGVNPDGTEKLPAIQGGSGVSLATDQIAMRAKHLLASDAGAAAFSNTATATMVLSKLYPNLMPGDTLAVGDVIEIEAWGSYVNNSGAERTLQLRAYFRYPERRNPGVELTNLGGVNLVSNASNPLLVRQSRHADDDGRSGGRGNRIRRSRDVVSGQLRYRHGTSDASHVPHCA
jgi:hypothetical protein